MTATTDRGIGLRFEHDGVGLAYDLLDGSDDLTDIDVAVWGDHDVDSPISCPLLIVRADPQLMPAFPPAHEERFRRLASKASFIVARGSGHDIHDEQPEWFADQVEAFLGSL